MLIRKHQYCNIQASIVKSETNTETETNIPNFEDHAIGNIHIFFLELKEIVQIN
jgi:hypothetical protein